MSGECGHRRRAARVEAGADQPRRGRAHGALRAGAARAGGRRDARRAGRSAAPHLAGAPRRARRADLSTHLLSRELRRQRLVRGRHRRGLRRLVTIDPHHGHSFLAPECRERAAQGDRYGEGARSPGDPRHRLPAQSLGHRRARRRRKPLRPLGESDRRPLLGPPRLRSDRRDRGGAARRGRDRGDARRHLPDPRAVECGHRVQARPTGLHRVSGSHSRRSRGRAGRGGIGRRGLQRARRRGCVSGRLSVGLSAGRAPRGQRAACECLRRAGGLAAALLARVSDPRRARSLPRLRQLTSRTARGLAAESPALGDDPEGHPEDIAGARDGGAVGVAAARASPECPRRAPREARSARSRCRGTRRRRSRRLWRAAGWHPRSCGSARCRARGALARAAGGAASLEAARLRGREPRRAPRAVARRAHRQVPVSVPPRRPGRAPRGSGAQSPASCGGLSGAATRAAARDRRPRANQPPERIARALALAAAVPLVRGLVAGGSILTDGAQAWLAGEKSDETATVEIAARFAALVEVWSTVRDPRLDRAERSAN